VRRNPRNSDCGARPGILIETWGEILAKYNLLNTLTLPGDLKKLGEEQQKLLCWEIRQKLIRTVSENGGHLASNLGTVELTVALHTVFDLPDDSIVWDVGHQCYTHKLLTGRADRFSTIRQEDGLSGFPRPSESKYDCFIAGHASTSISAACGLAKAKTLSGDPHHVIAVVGDGAFTGGMVYEGLNNAGRSSDRLIVVLNDNEMSISKSVGSFARYLAAKRASDGYLNLKDKVEGALVKIPVVGESVRDVVKQSKDMFRQAIYHSNLFEDLGFYYLGPVDGHDLPVLIKMLERAKEVDRPVLVHVNTVKGKGYPFAEQDPSKFHGVGQFNRSNGHTKTPGASFSSEFGRMLTGLAEKDDKIVAITAAMQDGTGLTPFAQKFGDKNRFFDVGIAEEHAVTFSCGLAAGGLRPVFAVYSTFLQRGFDQLIHDAAIEKQHIVLAVDRAGIVGDDGETHQGLYDAAFLSEIANCVVYSPATFRDLQYALERALYHTDGIAAVRYPRGGEPELSDPAFSAAEDYTHISSGGDTLLITYGRETSEVYKAVKLLEAQHKKADLLKLCKIHPLPEECVQIARKYRTILFVEEGVRSGGIGEHFLAALSAARYRGRMSIRAIENPCIRQMAVPAALKSCGLDAQSIAQTVAELYF